MDKKNVLIFPGGSEIGLEIHKSLQFCKDVQLYSAGSDVSNHASFVFNNHFIIPSIYEGAWIRTLNDLTEKYKIDYLFPAYDDIILALVQNSKNIKARIISSPLETCLICRYKSRTYEKFKDLLPVPKVFNDPSDVTDFPVFVKPDRGQGSQDASKVENPKALEMILENTPDLLILEYLPGKEYTVDCFTDRRKGLLFCRGRERVRIKAGISMNSKPIDNKTNMEFQKIANIISKELEFHGAWFFQLKISNSGIVKLLEIAPRISGTMATNRVLGVNFPLLSIYEAEALNIEIMANSYDLEIDRALINRYKHNIRYNKVYVDLDDTLIIDDKVNTCLISFLFQAINKGCKIILITKSADKLGPTLKKWRLGNIFDEVIWLRKNESKADFIDPEDAIFIDDSFSERKSVFSKLKIPTFDCSMIELLFDERV
ncbi:MAG: ATP-grasp domain-containing protein [Candidatus Bathyarchaeia archaeon]